MDPRLFDVFHNPADDDLAGGDDALLRQQRVLDAHAADLVIVDDVLRAREGYFRPWDHQLMFEMYTVSPNPDPKAGKWDIMTTSAPVPGPDESLEVLAPSRQENECKFA